MSIDISVIKTYNLESIPTSISMSESMVCRILRFMLSLGPLHSLKGPH